MRETVAVVLRNRTDDTTHEVEGRLVVAGMAITRSLDAEDRWHLTHIPSGLAFTESRCAEHIEAAAEMVKAVGVDWTRDTAAIVADQAAKELAQGIYNKLGWCVGCGPKREGPAWSVRCRTCNWQWEDEYDEGPLDAKHAKDQARDHQCEPEVEIAAPDGPWTPEWLVNDDGTIHEPQPAATTVELPEGDAL